MLWQWPAACSLTDSVLQLVKLFNPWSTLVKVTGQIILTTIAGAYLATSLPLQHCNTTTTNNGNSK
jgi:hypothetical protein